MNNFARLILAALALFTNAAQAAPPQLVKVYKRQDDVKNPDDDYCIVSEDVEEGSEIKLKVCNDSFQRDTKLWILSGKYWKAYRDPDLCVEVEKVKEGKSLRMRKCKGKSKQKWKFGEVGEKSDVSHDTIRPKSSSGLCVAFSGKMASAGADIYLADCDEKAIEWVAEEREDDGVVNTGKCRHLQLEDSALCIGIRGVGDDNPRTGMPLEMQPCDEDDGNQQWCPDSLGRFRPKKNKGVCWAPDCISHGCEIVLDHCELDLSQRFDNVEEDSDYPDSDSIKRIGGFPQCVTYAGDDPNIGDDITFKNGCNTQWVHYNMPSSDGDYDGNYRSCKFKLKGTSPSLCAGRVRTDFVELMKCSKDNTHWRWYDSGRIQAQIGGDNYWEGNHPTAILLQNPVDDDDQKFKLKGGKLVHKFNNDACVTYQGSYPKSGRGVIVRDCDQIDRGYSKWIAKCE